MFQATPHFQLIRTPGSPRADDLLQAQGRHAEEVEKILLGVQEERTRVIRDRSLTTEGKEERLRALGEKAEREIADLTARQVAPLRTRAERAGAVLSAPMRHRLPEGMDPDEVRELERLVREQLRGLDKVEVERVYLTAARKGDTVTVRAIERMPEPFRVVGDSAIHKARFLYAEARFPNDYRSMVDSDSTADYVVHNANRAREALAKMTGFQALPETWVSPNPTVPEEATAA